MICASPTPATNFLPGVLPVDRGDMQQETLPDGRIKLIYSYRGPNGPSKVKATLPRDIRIADIIKAKAALVEKAERRSLKTQDELFEDAVDIVMKYNNGAGMEWVYNRIKKDMAGPMDASMVTRFARYIDTLIDEKKSLNTIANHKSAIQRVLNVAYQRSMIDQIPIRDFSIKREFRDRVLTADERLSLENVMVRCKSHLYWSIKFAEKRPIRGLSDLWNLKRENLILFGEGSPYIKFYAQKTDLHTILPLVDIPEIVEYLKNALPEDCPYLFPRLDGEIESVFDFSGMKKSAWYKMGDPRSHFATLLRNAKIKDFHFHDFKRIATTAMLDSRVFTADELIDLGIYASRDMIDRCYKKRDAMTVLRRISVVPNVVPDFGISPKLVKNQLVANSAN